MVLKLTNFFVVILFFSISYISTFSQSDSGEGDPIDVEIKKKTTPQTRPQMPSRQSIVATYYNGILNIEFLMAEGDGVVYVYGNDGSCSLCENFDTSVPAIFMLEDVTLPSYTIIIETDAGHTYSGVLNL